MTVQRKTIMTDDALTKFKLLQKESWELFAPLEIHTTMPAANLVRFSRVKAGISLLDVGCGTGVVAITAARLGMNVSAIDLCPALLDRAISNATLADVNIDFKEADAETIPYPDHSFDAVLSQFGHMFAPRPEVTIQEMLRVLKPEGIIAFSTWPPDLYVGRLFNLVSKYCPPPVKVSPPSQWGDPSFVREQLGSAIEDLAFDQGLMRFPVLSMGHYRQSIETTLGPVLKLVQELQNDSARLKQFRTELEDIALQYFSDNHIHQHYLMSRARKKL